ncbi:MAG: agmatine deiminase family protein [Pirellulaceae bacterium]
MSDATPRELGYRWPAEWEPHRGTLLAWPYNRESWPGKFEPIPGVYRQLVETLAQFEPVHINAAPGPVMDEAERLVGSITNVTLHPIPTNDAWARDHGPTFLESTTGGPWSAVDWNYNAWGGKYPPWDDDQQVPARLAERLGFARFSPGIIMEGGAIDGNGAGLVLTTTECLLNPNRNPHLSQEQTETYLRDYLGAKKILWLDHGIAGDDTDGHIDELARFVSPRKVLAASEENKADENYAALQANLMALQEMTDVDGNLLEVVPLPMPSPLYQDDQRLPASYCNFYIANGAVLVPQFGDPRTDRIALELLKESFPEREIIPLPALDLVWGLGAFHCISQQIVG